ncbi:MAG: class I SAM-dependent methyltransferase [Aphanothece saxicola GSE-SYN-MK-01-06B]|jgi:2-polyprenyl-3-methyl-5-hydroxy-6-metoxy-1,4-benzoquinol methylase|nr:class I SAM-dependent methyltransferase [Aphanothece saxicola GSE-SYN-MK-01-06B]
MTPPEAGITFLSKPAPVHMADSWYEFSRPDHFWVKRRFEVMHRIIGGLAQESPAWLDVGCGTGVLQNYCQSKYGINVTGADLNVVALEQNSQGAEHTLCYDINGRKAELKEAFDIVSAMDVIEHLDDEGQFIESLLYHLKPGGLLLINVPAIQLLYSNYDIEAGHKRRYHRKDIARIAKTHQLKAERWSYWGFSLIPVLIARNIVTSFSEQSKIIQRGFSPSSPTMDSLLMFLSRLEKLPNHLLGTSMMAIFRK